MRKKVEKKYQVQNLKGENNSRKADLEDSMIGNNVDYTGGTKRVSIGDYSKIG